MAPIRVLVVDDSVVIRKVLSEVLAADPEIVIAGIAPDGAIALAKIPLLTPDIITLDIEMPNLSGLETLAQIRKLHPKLPVIMFSTLTERGAAATLDALAAGASDYATKPSNTGSLDETRLRIQKELLPKIKALCSARSSGKPAPTAIVPNIEHRAAIRREFDAPIEILAIGTSTGGPNALAAVLPQFSADLPVPVVITQHMPPLFTRFLAERLQKNCRLKVAEGEHGAAVHPGEIWIAPGDYHMTVVREDRSIRLRMTQDPPENSCRPAVDVMFRSVAKTFSKHVLGVVLTGMGSDGVRGSQAIKEAGGTVLVQDEATSVVWGMPGQVAAAGLADAVYPLDKIALEAQRRIARSGRAADTRWSQCTPGVST